MATIQDKSPEDAMARLRDLLPRIEHEDSKFCATALHEINSTLRRFPELKIMFSREDIATILGGGILRHVEEVRVLMQPKTGAKVKKLSAMEAAVLAMTGKEDKRGLFDKGESAIGLDFE